MRKYLLLFVFFVSFSANAQKHRDNFEIDAYKHTINYADRKLTFQLQPSDSELKFIYPDRNYYWYASNQLKITQGGFSGRLLHGIYTDFYANTSLKEQGLFKMGLKEGLWKEWTNEGILIAQTTYKAGKLQGHFYKYDQSGKLTEEGTYKNGRLNGKLKKYLANDSTNVTVYRKGEIRPAKNSKNWFKRFFSKKNKA